MFAAYRWHVIALSLRRPIFLRPIAQASNITTHRSTSTCNRSVIRSSDQQRCDTNDYTAVGFAAFLLFGKSGDEEETPEDKLINIIKRAILCIRQENYDKAERMLHLALRMAQDLQSKDGITYVYDVMANLALEREQFKKAQTLFTEVMKRLFDAGHTEENSTKILHISAKIAHMAQLQGDLEKSTIGFKWTLEKIEKLLKKLPDDEEVKELLGLTKSWYGQLLMKLGKYLEAKHAFEEAYECVTRIHGVTEEALTLLNNLSVAFVNLEDFAEAKAILMKALELVKQMKDSPQEGVLLANLGLVYLREGLKKQAQESCALAWRIGNSTKNKHAIEQAEYCLNEIKLL